MCATISTVTNPLSTSLTRTGRRVFSLLSFWGTQPRAGYDVTLPVSQWAYSDFLYDSPFLHRSGSLNFTGVLLVDDDGPVEFASGFYLGFDPSRVGPETSGYVLGYIDDGVGPAKLDPGYVLADIANGFVVERSGDRLVVDALTLLISPEFGSSLSGRFLSAGSVLGTGKLDVRVSQVVPEMSSLGYGGCGLAMMALLYLRRRR